MKPNSNMSQSEYLYLNVLWLLWSPHLRSTSIELGKRGLGWGVGEGSWRINSLATSPNSSGLLDSCNKSWSIFWINHHPALLCYQSPQKKCWHRSVGQFYTLYLSHSPQKVPVEKNLEICFVAIYAVLLRYPFCPDVRAFAWRNILPIIVSLGEKRTNIR